MNETIDANLRVVGSSVQRIDAVDKVNGTVKYTNDTVAPGNLHAALVTSTYAHAVIRGVDTAEAWKMPGVRAIVTGDVFPYPLGPLLADRPPLAVNKVRYYGEPVAVVVADTEHEAWRAAAAVQVAYEPLPAAVTARQAAQSGAPLLHEQLGEYKPQIVGVYPQPGTNIANHTKIRKGDMQRGWAESEVVVETEVSISPSDHAALEPRCARAEIRPDGHVTIYATSQGPFFVKKLLAQFFGVEEMKITVHTPLLGGAFGGKGSIQLEFIAYLASQAVGGRMVNLVNTREHDLISSPARIGLEAKVKLGATKDGKLQAALYTFLFDGGAYSDQAAGISKAAAMDCTGPYRVENVWCDSYCMYTNRVYATSFRGFGHPELTLAMERAMDLLAAKLGIDAADLRAQNAILPGDTTPTQTVLDPSIVGDLPACLRRARELIRWDEGRRIDAGGGKIRAKGIACIWKTSSTPPNAGSGAVITFNADGSVNLNCGAVDIGQGSKTVLAQILAERLHLDIGKINVTMDVNTQYNPQQWKTVASSTTYLAGRAVIHAADDAIQQLFGIAAAVLQCSDEDLDISEGDIFVKDNPAFKVRIQDVALGYKYPNGHSIKAQVIGRGTYIQHHLTPMDKETGFGKPGPWWTVGAQAVEIEYDEADCTYRLLKAVTVLDPGKVINPKLAEGQMRGGMFMGLSYACMESFAYDAAGVPQHDQLRTYKVMRFGEQPQYEVDFVETPSLVGPYGARGMGEYGVIGMAGALANCLSLAAGADVGRLPLTPETVWRAKGEGLR